MSAIYIQVRTPTQAHTKTHKQEHISTHTNENMVSYPMQANQLEPKCKNAGQRPRQAHSFF